MYEPLNLPYTHAVYDGVPVPVFTPRERFEEIKNHHKSRTDDVYIATYQKCGTTWMQHILNQLFDFPQGQQDYINQSVPWLEETEQTVIDDLKSPRIFKTHDRWSWVPKGEGIRYIYAIRNPKDACCSYYNHMSKVFTGHYAFEGNFEDFYNDVFIKKRTAEHGWFFDHVSEWLAQKGNPNIYFIYFEDMVEDLEREVKNLAEFLKINCSDKKIRSIVDSSQFDSMTKNSSVDYSWRNGVSKDPTSKFLNKGKVGSWTSILSEAQSSEIEKLAREHVEIPHGIKFRYLLS